MKFIPAAVVLSLFIFIPAFAAEGKAVYCATNNVIVYSARPSDNLPGQSPAVPGATDTSAVLAPAYFDPSVPLTNGQSAPLQMMKYDRATLLATEGNWARVRRDGEGADSYVLASALADWDVKKFFGGKDNVFKAEKEMTLWGTALTPLLRQHPSPAPGAQTGAGEGKVMPGETYRVLKGVADRFYVVTPEGKAGWVDGIHLKCNELVLRNLILTSSRYYSGLSNANVYLTQFEKYHWDYYQTNLNKIFSYRNFQIYSLNSVKDVRNFIGINFKQITNIEVLDYKLVREFYSDYYGFFVVFDLYLPLIVENEIFDLNVKYPESLTFDIYTNYIKTKYLKQKELLIVRFFTKDISFNLVKQVIFNDYLAFEYLLFKEKSILSIPVLDANGDLNIKLSCLDGNGAIDPIPILRSKAGSERSRFVVCYSNEYKYNSDFVFKKKYLDIKISQSDCDKADMVFDPLRLNNYENKLQNLINNPLIKQFIASRDAIEIKTRYQDFYWVDAYKMNNNCYFITGKYKNNGLWHNNLYLLNKNIEILDVKTFALENIVFNIYNNNYFCPFKTGIFEVGEGLIFEY